MSEHGPLASLLRPQGFDDFVGNEALTGEQGVLRRLADAQDTPSMILWGPPGCGKTSLVHIFENTLDAEVIVLSAISAGVKDIKQIAHDAQAQQSGMFAKTTIVFVDEIHRFNKSQQDAFLPYVESGVIKLIGATTENPAFSINRALLSRMRVFTLNAIDSAAMQRLCTRALNYLSAQPNYLSSKLTISKDALDALVLYADGDARKCLNSIEIAAKLAQANEDGERVIEHAILEAAVGESIAAFDKQGDHYYDLLSAFHKSIRGSSVDASLYWYARMLVANTDVTPICRRLLAIASEDIGNADPKALQICLNAWDIYHRVGSAEGERAIAQAVIYCALAPKSNAVYNAFKAAKRDALRYNKHAVPLHLRNAPTSLAKEAGHGKHYEYPHNNEQAYAVGVNYFPEGMEATQYYAPNPRGFEKQLMQKIAYLKSLEDGGTQ
ncbi:replication-associated recombination protein A [Glaciecola siphonariae]|uniref:Replication-associated recombination protein A n=1 Tax=Glaciecola siphonariae TaxID=521012 RepID=A0ABV9LT52_9ALTE